MVVTRRNAASAEPTQPALRRSIQRESPTPEPSRKRGRKPKAASAQVESVADTQSQSALKVSSTPRAAASVTTTAVTSTLSKRTTRASKAAGTGSPLRALGTSEPKRQPEKKRKRIAGQAASATPEPEPSQAEPAQDEDDEQGVFFSKNENEVLRKENFQLRARVNELETSNAFLSAEITTLRAQLSAQHHAPLAQLSTGQVEANIPCVDFDSHMMDLPETVPSQPTFVNSSESAIALLHKIENAAKESSQIEPSIIEDGGVDHETKASQVAPQQSASKTQINQSLTPARLIASPSGFFSRSFSALKSRLGFSKSTSTPQQPEPTPSAPSTSRAPPANTFTEVLSLPPTPIGERVQTPTKKKKISPTLKALLKGVDPKDKAKAEDWAKQILPQLKNDRAFHDKRRRLETPVMFKDLNHFPSSKPWETGFGDPLADLDDEDIVPGWAVYLDMVAEEEEHKAKKHKTMHEVTMDDDDILSINEQYAASIGSRSSPKLHDSHGQSASLLDFHPRRSVEPSPMFETPVSHQRGGNVFSELQGHDSAAQTRANDREFLQNATKQTVNTHNPSMGSFSVPDDSDDEDTTLISEASEADAAPLWTQPPPPAPVPAHAPLPEPVADAPNVPDSPSVSAAQQPVDEIERQRQKLMKHTPAKPSRLREATYPSPSLLSDAGNDSILAATPVQVATSMASLFDDMPVAEALDIDEEDLQAANALMATDEWKQQLAANPWPAAILSYESDEEGLSPE